MLFEMPKMHTLSDAREAYKLIVDALIEIQYSGRNMGRSNSARRKHRILMNTYAEEFVARCNSSARNETDVDTSQEWHDLRNMMIKEAQGLVNTKEKVADIMQSVW